MALPASLQGRRREGSSMTRLRDLKKRLMEDPKFREEYAQAEREYAPVARVIRARMAGSSHKPKLPSA